MTLRAEIFGDGPDLVMLPGWAMPAAVLRPWAHTLAPRWRVWLVDLPGQGGCTRVWPDLAELPAHLVEALPARALWLGWSLGGQLLLAAARQAPPAALCLLATSPRFCGAGAWPGVAAAALQQMRDDLDLAPERVVSQFLALLGGRGEGARAAARALRGAVGEAPAQLDALRAGLAALAGLDLRECLPQIPAPTRWIVGDQDPLVPAAALEWAAAQMPSGTARVIAGAGHIVFQSHPAAVEAELDALRVHLEAA